MVIECAACQTRFRLADDKVKAEGTKVRCSKCRQIFTVYPPSPEPAIEQEEVDFGEFNMEPVADAPTESPVPAAAPEAGIAPTLFTPSLRQEPEEETVFFSPPPSGPDDLTTGEEFSFEDEGMAPSEDLPSEAPDESGEAGEFSIGETGSVEFTFEEETSETMGTPAASTEIGLGVEDFSFDESTEEFSVDEPLPDEGEEVDGADLGFDETGPDGFPQEETTAEAASGEEDVASADFSFDEGDSPSFSFEDDAPFDQPGELSWNNEAEEGNAGFGFPTPSAPPAEARESKAEAAPAARVELDREPEFFAPPPERPERQTALRPDLGLEPPPKKARRSPMSLLVAALIILLVVLSGIAGYFFWQGGPLEIARLIDQVTGQAPPPPATGQVLVSDLSSTFVSNQEAGQLLVVDGQVVNKFNESRSAIAVKGTLFDKAGKPLLQQTVFCGNPLDRDRLEKMPFAKIEEAMNNQFGDSLSNLNVAPGKAIPFTIVFRNLPPGVAEFTVEVTDSRPGTRK